MRVQQLEEGTHDAIERLERTESKFSEIMDDYEKTKEALNQALHGLERIKEIQQQLNDIEQAGGERHPRELELSQQLHEIARNFYIAKKGLEEARDDLQEEEELTASLEEMDVKIEQGVIDLVETYEHSALKVDDQSLESTVDDIKEMMSEERSVEI